VVYTPAQVRALTPIRESVEKRAALPDLRDVFLCHAWDDRKGAAKDLHDRLESLGVSVWFSEKDVILGSRTGLDTSEDSMADVAAKLAELVAPDECPGAEPQVAG
jgi:hypothetical protein